MTEGSVITSYLTYMTETKNAPRNTLAAYKRDLSVFADYLSSCSLDIAEALPETIEAFKQYLNRKGFSCSSVSRYMSSVRSFYKYLLVNGIVPDNPTKTVKNDKKPKRSMEILTAKEIELLLIQPDPTEVKGIRDRAILETLYATGMKATEVVSLNISDVNLQLGFVVCHGEGSQKHDRTVYLYPAAVKALKDYFENARSFLADPDDQAVFVNVNGSRMTRQGLWKILKSYAEAAGIRKTITPHTLRHSFAMHLLANGADVNDIKEILGHADLSSMNVYTEYLKSRKNGSYLKFHPRA